ncbi:antibiotic biosynthesis monooxygenase family protein [Chloroflexota bacterium]
MTKVIIERRVKSVEQVLSLLKRLRIEAMHQPGYLGGETLLGTQDKSIITVITSWESIKDWKAWEKSEERTRLYQQIEKLLVEEPKITTYRYLSFEKDSPKA